MSIKIEVKNGVATSRNVTAMKGKNAGQVMTMTEQEAWAFTADRDGNPAPYPTRISINLEQGQQPYPPGIYTLAPQSIYVGDFGKLKIGRTVLVPLNKG